MKQKSAHNWEQPFRRGVKWSLWGGAASSVLQLLQMLIFARLTDAAALGDYALAAALMAFVAPVAEAGLNQAIVQRQELHAGDMAAMLWLNMLLCVLLVSGIWFSSDVLAGWFERPDLAGLFRWISLAHLFTPIGAQFGGLLVRHLQFKAAAWIEFAATLSGILLMSWLAWRGHGAFSMAAGYLLRNFLASLGCLWAGWRLMPIAVFSPSNLSRVLPFFRFGAWDTGARWVDFLSNYLDKIIIGKTLGVQALGMYNLVFSALVAPTSRIGAAVARVSFPVFSRLQDDAEARQEIFDRANREVLLLLVPVYFTMAMLAAELIWLGFGRSYILAAPLLAGFALVGIGRSCWVVLPELTKGLGKPEYLTVSNFLWVVSLTVSLLVFLWIAPTAESAVWSRVLARLGPGMLLWVLLLRRLGGRHEQFFRDVFGILVFLLPGWLAIYLWEIPFAVRLFIALASLIGLVFFSGFRDAYRSMWQSLMTTA